MVDSPCNGACEILPQGFCRGCLRTPGEIGTWPVMAEIQRLAVLRAIRQRRARLRCPGCGLRLARYGRGLDLCPVCGAECVTAG